MERITQMRRITNRMSDIAKTDDDGVDRIIRIGMQLKFNWQYNRFWQLLLTIESSEECAW